MYFGRNDYDPNAVTEAQSRLRDFQGATSISSNQYFGREEDDDLHGAGGGADGSLLGDGSLAGLELAARDAVSRVMANPDVQNMGESIRAGALKVRNVLYVCSKLSMLIWYPLHSSPIILHRWLNGNGLMERSPL